MFWKGLHRFFAFLRGFWKVYGLTSPQGLRVSKITGVQKCFGSVLPRFFCVSSRDEKIDKIHFSTSLDRETGFLTPPQGLRVGNI